MASPEEGSCSICGGLTFRAESGAWWHYDPESCPRRFGDKAVFVPQGPVED